MRHISLHKRSGFSISEVLIVVAVMGVVMAGVFTTLQTGGMSSTQATARLHVRAELRRAADWIAKDVRQARRVDVGSTANVPTSSHIRFQMVTGYSPATGDVTLSPDVIEYDYDSVSRTIVRRETTADVPPVIKTWTFRYIDEAPFYTRVTVGGVQSLVVIDGVGGNPSPVIQSGNLVVQLVGTKEITSGVWTEPFYLTEEVRIRN